MPTGADGALSRRGLFGAGLSRALAAPWGGEPAPVPRRTSAVVPVVAGAQAEPLAERMLQCAGLTAPTGARVVVVAAGDGTPLAARAVGCGQRVIAVEADRALRERGLVELPDADWRGGRAGRLPVADAGADAVLAWFGAAFEPDARGVAAELRRVVRPGGAIVMAACKPSPWTRYETAYRHFFGLPGLDVLEATVEVGEGSEPLVCAIVVVSSFGDDSAGARR